MSDVSDLTAALYGRDVDGRPAIEGDIPALKRTTAEHSKALTQLRMAFIAAICLGIANGAGQILGGGGWPT